MITETLYRLPFAANLLKVHPRTLKRWHQAGLIQLVELPGGQFRVPGEEITRIMQGDPLPCEEEPLPEE